MNITISPTKISGILNTTGSHAEQRELGDLLRLYSAKKGQSVVAESMRSDYIPDQNVVYAFGDDTKSLIPYFYEKSALGFANIKKYLKLPSVVKAKTLLDEIKSNPAIFNA